MWNPPLTDAALGARRSALGEAAELLARLVREGARAICFMKSRKGVELLSRLVKQDLEASGQPQLAELIEPYRAGYTPQQRRELEGRLTRGELRAVITTDALELGIDIGELDAARRRHLPRHGRLAAPDVGARRAARARPGGICRRRGRAGPVLLPPPRRVPRPSRGGRDPRPREPADLRRAPAVRGARGAARPRRRRVLRSARAGAGRAARQRRAPARACRAARRGRPRGDRPGNIRAARPRVLSRGGGVAALGLPGHFRDRRRLLGRAARPDRGRARPFDRARGRDLPAPGALLRGARPGPGAPPRAGGAVSRATGTPSPSARR